MDKPPIKVLLVDDSQLALTAISKGLARSPDIQVVGTALNGLEALALIPKLRPDIICTDYFMPKMGGLELTKNIMATSPTPILVMSSRLEPKTSQEVFQLLEAGALDCIKKPLAQENDPLMRELQEKIRILSKVFLLKSAKKPVSTSKAVVDNIKPKKHHLVIIGASTGGPNVLVKILSALPATFPVPIVCIQHISHGFLDAFIEWLKGRCTMKVEQLRTDTQLQPGVIYLPKEDMHFVMKSSSMGGLSSKIPYHNHRPSITVGMSSVAEYVKGDAIGILLTGMGNDGAEGMAALTQKGALTIAQDEESCTVFGMPKEAIALGGANLVLNPDEVTALLLRLFQLRGA